MLVCRFPCCYLCGASERSCLNFLGRRASDFYRTVASRPATRFMVRPRNQACDSVCQDLSLNQRRRNRSVKWLTPDNIFLVPYVPPRSTIARPSIASRPPALTVRLVTAMAKHNCIASAVRRFGCTVAGGPELETAIGMLPRECQFPVPSVQPSMLSHPSRKEMGLSHANGTARAESSESDWNRHSGAWCLEMACVLKRTSNSKGRVGRGSWTLWISRACVVGSANWSAHLRRR